MRIQYTSSSHDVSFHSSRHSYNLLLIRRNTTTDNTRYAFATPLEGRSGYLAESLPHTTCGLKSVLPFSSAPGNSCRTSRRPLLFILGSFPFASVPFSLFNLIVGSTSGEKWRSRSADSPMTARDAGWRRVGAEAKPLSGGCRERIGQAMMNDDVGQQRLHAAEQRDSPTGEQPSVATGVEAAPGGPG